MAVCCQNLCTHLKQLLFFPGVAVPANSLQGQTVQRLTETVKNPKYTPQTLKASVSILNVKVHDTKMRKTLSEFGKIGRRNPHLSKKEHGNTAYVCKVSYEKTTRALEQRPKWRCLDFMHSTTFRGKPKSINTS